MEKASLLHNAGPRHENRSFLISKHTDGKLILGCSGAIPVKKHLIVKMIGRDNAAVQLQVSPHPK